MHHGKANRIRQSFLLGDAGRLHAHLRVLAPWASYHLMQQLALPDCTLCTACSLASSSPWVQAEAAAGEDEAGDSEVPVMEGANGTGNEPGLQLHSLGGDACSEEEFEDAPEDVSFLSPTESIHLMQVLEVDEDGHDV